MKPKRGKKPKVFLELIRPLNCVMAGFGVFIGYCIATGTIGFNQFVGIAMLAAFFVCAGGQAINDVFDARIDEEAHPAKPIPSRRISKKSAGAFAIALFGIGNILAGFLPVQSFIIAIAFTIVLLLYSAKMQRIKYIGNWVVALGTAFTLIFGASLIGNYFIISLLALAALLANVAREIIKDAQDIDSDWQFKVSLPIKIGIDKAKPIVLALHLLAIITAFFVFFALKFGGSIFFILIVVASAIFLYSSKLFFSEDFEQAQNFSKIGMIIALVGFLTGVIGF